MLGWVRNAIDHLRLAKVDLDAAILALEAYDRCVTDQDQRSAEIYRRQLAEALDRVVKRMLAGTEGVNVWHPPWPEPHRAPPDISLLISR